MFAPLVMAALVASSMNLPPNLDLAAIPRSIAKEPTYVGQPRYALLVFGKDARTRIWIVRDDKSLYVDRKGNGDLTEPANRIQSSYGSYYSIDQLVEQDGMVHRNIFIQFTNQTNFRIRLGNNRDGRTQYVGYGRMGTPSLGDRPVNAPIIHFNGPRTLANFGPTYTLPRGGGPGRAYKLRLMLGTPGLGAGTFASFSDVCSEQLGNLRAEFAYPSAREPGQTFHHRTELVHDG